MQRLKKESRPAAIALTVIILLQCVFFAYIFAVKKTAYHEDEYFTYALSNSYKRPFLYGSKLQVLDNYDKWMSGDDFKYYVRVNDDTRFHYDSVWYNNAEDNHPPLYHALLHTLCSIAPIENFWLYGFAVNLLCLIFTQIFLYLLVIQLCRSRMAALLCCSFWCLTVAGQDNVMFIRMYAMLTMFTVIYAYFSIRLFRHDKVTVRDCIPVAAAALLGALTQHMFLAFAFFLTFLECAYFCLTKRFRTMFTYGLSALAGILLSIAVFPATITHFDQSRFEYSKEPDFRLQTKVFSRLFLKNTTGFKYVETGWFVYAKVTLIALVILCPFVIFLFRKEPWMLRLRGKAKALPSALKKKLSLVRSLDPAGIFLFTDCLLLFLYTSKRVQFFDFGDDSIRYLFMLVPIMCAVVISLVFIIIERVKKSCPRNILKAAVSLVLAALLVFQNVTGEYRYILSNGPKNGTVSEYTKGQDCLLLVTSSIFLPCFSTMLEDAEDVYTTLLTNKHYRDEDISAQYDRLFEKGFTLVMDITSLYTDEKAEEIKNGKPTDSLTDVLMAQNFDETRTIAWVIADIEVISGCKAEYLTTETTHQIDVSVYRFTPQSKIDS